MTTAETESRGGAVNIENVSKTFGGVHGRATPVLANISLAVKDGEFIAIIGPSGCGKSTLLSIIAGYTDVDAGTIRVGNEAITGPGPDRVMVFQQPTLFPWLSAEKNIAFGLRLKANRDIARTAAIKTEAQKLLDLVGLRSFGAYYPLELSGGMQQRVEIARALAVHPKVLLMDEPFGALDALTRRSMQQELARIHSGTGCTTLFITHDVYEAIVLADRVVVMSQRPARIKEIIAIDFDADGRSQNRVSERRDSAEAAQIARHISDLLDVDKGTQQ